MYPELSGLYWKERSRSRIRTLLRMEKVWNALLDRKHCCCVFQLLTISQQLFVERAVVFRTAFHGEYFHRCWCINLISAALIFLIDLLKSLISWYQSRPVLLSWWSCSLLPSTAADSVENWKSGSQMAKSSKAHSWLRASSFLQINWQRA